MIARVEHEINMNWAEQAPALFVKAVDEFQRKYNTHEWKVSIDISRPRYVTLRAVRHFGDNA